MGGWAGSRANMDVVEKRKIPCPARIRTPNRLARILVSIANSHNTVPAPFTVYTLVNFSAQTPSLYLSTTKFHDHHTVVTLLPIKNTKYFSLNNNVMAAVIKSIGWHFNVAMCHAWHACHLLMPSVIYRLHMLQLKTPLVQIWPPPDICKRPRLPENCVVTGTTPKPGKQEQTENCVVTGTTPKPGKQEQTITKTRGTAITQHELQSALTFQFVFNVTFIN
jgi:hypothetical protein